MQRLLAIAILTLKAAFRFRLFWVLSALLLGAVVVLPLLLKDDQTARGFTQILLTYNLSVITMLLGISTLWLACGTLARDIEDGQMQMVAVKPVPRWQIWLGKWLGIMMLNALLLTIAGTSVFVLLKWRAARLPAEQQLVLRNEVFVARASLKQETPDLDEAINRTYEAALKKTPIALADRPLLRRQVEEQLKAALQIVDPGHAHGWTIDLGLRKHLLRDQPLYIRTKFHAAQTNEGGAFVGYWQVGTPDVTPLWRDQRSQAADTFHEFQIPANLFDSAGVLRIGFLNRNNTRLLFPLEDGMEVLYREGGFGLNYARGLAIILGWMGLLAALGLAAASLLSFPVAAFCALSLLVMSLSTGTLASVVAEGGVGGEDHEGEKLARSWVDRAMVPIYKGVLSVVSLAEAFSPVDALSNGRSITWGELAKAWFQTVLVLGGAHGLIGIFIFSRRELATAQGT